MLRLNPEINIDDYIENWKQNSIITIDNLLLEEDANEINEYLLALPDDQWDYSIHPYINNLFTFSNIPSNKEYINIGIKSANAANDIGEFSYCFRRHDQDIGVRRLLSSPEFLKLINDITNMDIKDVNTIFASMYEANSFLSTHTDIGRGKLAFVFNLTKNWNENNGGCFELLGKNYIKVAPKFNSLTIFNVENNGVPHRVTKVNSDVKEKRIAFSGWF